MLGHRGVLGSVRHPRPRRNRELLAELFGWHARGKIDPHISAAYPLERAADALNDLLERKALGKIVLLP